MEGVGARLGRSSTRYGPSAAVFNGPVRKWKKKWVSPPSSNNNASSNHHSHQSANHHNGNNNNTNGSHLLLYKWTPISQTQNNNGSSNGDKNSPQHDAAAVEEPPRRKFKYIPIAVLEEQRNEAEDKVEDETKPSDTDSNAAQRTSKNGGLNDKPDINDVPMGESEPPDDNPLARQDLNVSTLDLSLGLKASDGDGDSDGEDK